MKDVAAELTVGEPSVRGLISTGELAAIQIGGRGVWRVERSRLEEYISAQYARTAETLNEPGQDPEETAED
ncbi:helix-turn-helix domain-containing protein [Arthrobacter sp. H14]|uniref:helix-turn-helix domain-containing protein n=1 Tax=Arthrobacter sp. H14 TaxID=1312959 RepID=UPI0009E06A00|nr:helix-turn-helix domain-containing protein [Arthrobacter sp. H14]